MSKAESPRSGFFSPRLFYWCNLALAGGLVGLVALSPWFAPTPPAQGWHRLIAVFAADTTVRRIAVAGAIGLAVTAGVFFRQTAAPMAGPTKPPARKPPRLPPSSKVVGA